MLLAIYVDYVKQTDIIWNKMGVSNEHFCMRKAGAGDQ
jgi:L-amino acid N-acyltransferase YncA